MKPRGFTLIEAVLCVVVLGLAVPPALELMQSAAAHRADGVNTGRATVLSGLVIESVLADLASGNETLGFEALADPAVYLETPTTGLYARLAPLVAPFEQVGMGYSVSVSDLISSTGFESSDEAQNVFRLVTVTVRYPSSDGPAWELPVSVVVGDL